MNHTASVGIVRSGLTVAREALRYAVDRVVPAPRGVPDRATAITPGWLDGAMGLTRGTITSIGVAAEHHGTASRTRLEIESVPSSDVPDHVFVKLAPRTLGGRVFMNVMGLGDREARFYTQVAPELPIRVPRCFAAVVDPRRGRNAIVLEDLGDRARFRDITESCSVDEARAVVEALADLHAAYWSSPRFATDLASFAPRHDTPAAMLAGALVRRVIERPSGMVAETVPSDVQRSSRVLVEHRESIGAFWAAEPPTFAHNDTHLGNLFFEDGVPGFLDWQNAAVGPGIRDVAYFVLPSLEPPVARETERELVSGYVARLASNGIHVDESHMWDCYRAAASQFFVGAVVTGAFGGRLQRAAVARTGIQRAVAAVGDLRAFELLREVAVGGHA